MSSLNVTLLGSYLFLNNSIFFFRCSVSSLSVSNTRMFLNYAAPCRWFVILPETLSDTNLGVGMAYVMLALLESS